MISEIKPKIQPFINVIAKPLIMVNPNILSVIGLVFPVLFLYFMTQHNYFVAIFMLAGTAFDTMDGAVAKLANKVTKFGAFLDSTLDRIADALVIIAFYYAGLVSLEVILIVLVESYLISYIRSRAELAGNSQFVLNVGIIERPERILIIAVGLVFALFYPTFTQVIFIALAILSFVTVIQRFVISYKKLSTLT